MFRKSIFGFAAVAVVMFVTGLTAFGQIAITSGRIELVKEGGTREGVGGAVIEVYRTDAKGTFPTGKSGKKGDFSFAGFAIGGIYALSVSAPNCAPAIFPNVRAGQEKIVVIMKPGDGRKWTEADVRTAIAGAGKGAVDIGGSATSEAKGQPEKTKEQVDYEKQVADVDSKNKKLGESDAIAMKANDAGSAARKEKNYDLAIAKYSEGITAVPDFVGSTPILLLGRMAAQKDKGFAMYRAATTISDQAERRVKFAEANKFYDDALASFTQAVDIIDKAAASSDPAEQKRRESNRLNLYQIATDIHRIKVLGNVDIAKAPDSYAVYQTYFGIETDPVAKVNAQVALGDVMRLSGDFDKAVAAYRAVLAAKPDSPEGMAGLGLSLFAQGVSTVPEDNDKKQEGLNMMQRYTELAPILGTDSAQVKELKTSVKEAVDYMKAQKMAPQKPAAGGKKKP